MKWSPMVSNLHMGHIQVHIILNIILNIQVGLSCVYSIFCNPRQHHQQQPIQIKAYGQVPENIPEEDACSSALNLLRMMKEKRMVENNKKRVILKQLIHQYFYLLF